MDAQSPATINTIAIHRQDVVQAYELRERRQEPAVLRVTPPFSGRMRGRLHIATGDSYQPGSTGAPVHIMPETILTDPPSFPMPDQTAPVPPMTANYDPEQHHSAHTAAVSRWRQTVAEQITDRISLALPAGKLSAQILALGQWPPQSKSEL